jgi:hypothetical protein
MEIILETLLLAEQPLHNLLQLPLPQAVLLLPATEEVCVELTVKPTAQLERVLALLPMDGLLWEVLPLSEQVNLAVSISAPSTLKEISETMFQTTPSPADSTTPNSPSPLETWFTAVTHLLMVLVFAVTTLAQTTANKTVLPALVPTRFTLPNLLAIFTAMPTCFLSPSDNLIVLVMIPWDADFTTTVPYQPLVFLTACMPLLLVMVFVDLIAKSTAI